LGYHDYIWWPIHEATVLAWQMDERIEYLLTPSLREQPEGSAPVNLPSTKVMRGKAKLIRRPHSASYRSLGPPKIHR